MLYHWVLPTLDNELETSQIADELKIHPVIARILYSRQLNSRQKIQKYFNYDINDLHDPFLLAGMDLAVDRIINALRDGEDILIYGDYDVDGVTGVSILYDGLFSLGGKVSFFIPNRFREGYGVSMAGITEAKRRNISLIITVDCGITAIDEVDQANSLGIDVIICDHHEPADELPKAIAVLDPKIKGSEYPFKELAGCGVAYKFLQGLGISLKLGNEFPNQYLDLVAIGTSADIVQLIDENRILVKNGLDRINQNPRPGVYTLIESCNLLGKDLSVSNIVFILAPRLNAVGRISSAKKAVHLLTTKSLQQGRNIARILENENRARKTIDETTFEEAKQMIEEQVDIETARILVLSKVNWHTGVIGIVASRLMEKYNRPTILISIQDGVGKGSARSMPNFDVYAAFQKLRHLLISFGGHRFAAGISIDPENIRKFDQAINQLCRDEQPVIDLVPKLNIDAIIDFDQFTANFFKDLNALAPFGPGNMRPIFASYDLETYGNITVVGHNHLKVKLRQKSVVLDAIGYNLGDLVSSIRRPHRQLNCAYVLEETKWSGQTTIQIRIKDFEVIPNA
jgi:single-stranded-DNA-specific exonuclease